MKYNGPTTLDLVFIVFLALKLAKIITWHWAFIFMPIYIPVIIAYIIKWIKAYKVLKALKETTK